MLKFEGIPVGNVVRAYDFKPMESRPDSYIEGVIFGEFSGPYKGYRVRVINDSDKEDVKYSRIGLEVIVPMEVSHDYDGRVVDITK